MTICAIHQPNFFPWTGYFDKIRQADVFIFLDEVAYPKSGSGSGSWCNRVKLMSEDAPDWYGIPIKRESGVQLIKNVVFLDKEHAVKKIIKKLMHNYKKYPNYIKVMPIIESLLLNHQQDLAEYNIHAIKTIAHLLGFKTEFVRQSELKHSQHSTELLIELIAQVGADTYLCGNGASGYQEDALYSSSGIKLVYQDLEYVKNYPLSIVHTLMLQDNFPYFQKRP